jgi:hypothetical protein
MQVQRPALRSRGIPVVFAAIAPELLGWKSRKGREKVKGRIPSGLFFSFIWNSDYGTTSTCVAAKPECCTFT